MNRDVPVKFGDSRSNRSLDDIGRPPHFVTDDNERRRSWHKAKTPFGILSLNEFMK